MAVTSRVQGALFDAALNPIVGIIDLTLNAVIKDSNGNYHSRDKVSFTLGTAAAGVQGTVSAATANTLTDSTKNWAVNIWKDTTVTIISGTGAVETGTVASNTATQITLTANWTVTPDTTSTYQINGAFDVALIPNDGATTPSGTAYSLTLRNTASSPSSGSVLGYFQVTTAGSPLPLSSILKSNYAAKDLVTFVKMLNANDDLVQITSLGQDFKTGIAAFSQGTHTGLSFAYNAGRLRNNNVVVSVLASSVTLTNGVTNYVEITPASGVVSANTVGFTVGRVPLYTAVTSGGAITTVTDQRCWIDTGFKLANGAAVQWLDNGGNTITGVMLDTGNFLELYGAAITIDSSGNMFFGIGASGIAAVGANMTAAVTLAVADVVIVDTTADNQVKTTTTANDNNPQVIIYGAGAGQACVVARACKALVTCDTGAVARLDRLVTSTTAKQATVNNAQTDPVKILGIALTAKAAGSSGTVTALIR